MLLSLGSCENSNFTFLPGNAPQNGLFDLLLVLGLGHLIVNPCLLALIVFVHSEGEKEKQEKECKCPNCLRHSNLVRRVHCQANEEPHVGEDREESRCHEHSHVVNFLYFASVAAN